MQIFGCTIPLKLPHLVILVSLAAASGNFTPPARAQAPAPGMTDTWHHLAALQPGTHIHISSDKKSRTCFFTSADDQNLVCSRRRSARAEFTFPRAQVRSVKLTRYGVSTLAGMGIGAGAGLAIGAAASPGNSASGFSGLDREVITGIGGVIGFLAGAAIGGPTDFLRGPTLYRRPGL